MEKNKKIRIDQLLVEKGLAETREKAQRLLMAGLILIDEKVVYKPGKIVSSLSCIRKKKGTLFVSRGGDKLNGLFEDYPLQVKDKICLDIGSSTGGFTDCLLKKGVKRVYSIDVGKGLIDWSLRNDPRVILMEKVNARYLTQDMIPEQGNVCVMDVSFISIEKILPALYNLITPGGFIISLIKPQFEAGKDRVGKKGIIKDTSVHSDVIERIKTFAKENHLMPKGVFPSKVKGAKGNQEFFIVLKKE